jgi:hypothetical protein
MPMDETCLEWIEKTVSVFPKWGYGWHLIDNITVVPSTPPAHIKPPAIFHVRIKEFVNEDNKIAGGFGKIEEPNHEFDGFWIAFFARTDDVLLNFTTNVGPYNILIAPDKPQMTLKPGLRALHPNASVAYGFPRLTGYGEIGFSA